MKIKSLSEYLKAICVKTRSMDDEDVPFWFRGEGSVDWNSLSPGSYRIVGKDLTHFHNDEFDSKTVKQIENNIESDFSRKALPYIISRGIENNPWNRYFLMQHYRVSTRLLDWSENAITALFFATTDQKVQSNDAKIWILRPHLLNNYTVNKILGNNKTFKATPQCSNISEPKKLLYEENKISITELTRRYLRMDFVAENSNKSTPYYPLAIHPAYLDQRMAAQKTCFTIFGNQVNGLKSIKDKKIINSVTIPHESKKQIIKDLRVIGFDFESIYPDLDGLGLSIGEKYKNSFYDNRELLPKYFI